MTVWSEGRPAIHIICRSYQISRVRRSFATPRPLTDFPTLAAIARMGHKYKIDVVLETALSKLRMTLVSDLEAWVEDTKGQCVTHTPHLYAIEAVNLFRRVQRPDMLDIPMYLCSLLDPDLLVGGTRRKDGTLERLSPEDLALCIGARQRLTLWCLKELASLCYNPHNSPHCAQMCEWHLKRQFCSYATGAHQMHLCSPLHFLCSLRTRVKSHPNICIVCKSAETEYLVRRKAEVLGSLRSLTLDTA